MILLLLNLTSWASAFLQKKKTLLSKGHKSVGITWNSIKATLTLFQRLHRIATICGSWNGKAREIGTRSNVADQSLVESGKAAGRLSRQCIWLTRIQRHMRKLDLRRKWIAEESLRTRWKHDLLSDTVHRSSKNNWRPSCHDPTTVSCIMKQIMTKLQSHDTRALDYSDRRLCNDG